MRELEKVNFDEQNVEFFKDVLNRSKEEMKQLS